MSTTEETNENDTAVKSSIPPHILENTIMNGFHLATAEGPLCQEPMSGVAFLIQEVRMKEEERIDVTTTNKWPALSGKLISNMRDACRESFLKWSPRLMLATYQCNLQAPSDVLGRVYGVLSKRKGKILSEELREGTPFFSIQCTLPVIESFGFADELRKRTSGAASPQLVFGGFEVLDIDPFWIPSTEEELEDWGEKADRDNLAKKYVDKVRERKGLFVDKKVVEHAEKQKNLKNK